MVRSSREVIHHDPPGQPGDDERGGGDEPSSLFVDLGFVLLKPQNFWQRGLRGQSISAGIENVIFAKPLVHFRDFLNGSGVHAVEDSISQGLKIFVHRQDVRANRAYSEPFHVGRRNAWSRE